MGEAETGLLLGWALRLGLGLSFVWHVPKASWHPVAQYASEVPQNPEELQHMPLGHILPHGIPQAPEGAAMEGAGVA
jgi:hypothetical protein